MYRRIRAVEHRKRVTGLADAHPGLQDRILLKYTWIENAHKVRKKTSYYLLCIEVHQTFSFPFSLLWHYQMPEYFYVMLKTVLKTAVFELMQQFYHATEIGNAASGVSACVDEP